MAVVKMPAARRPVHVAVFEATTLIARGVREQLVSRSFPIASVRLFTSSSDPDANLAEFGGEAMLVTAPDLDALGPLDVAFLCGTAAEGRRYLDWASLKGFVAIDLTTAANAAPEVPLVNAAVNPEAIPASPTLIATPHPIGLFLSSLLAPIRNGCGIERASIVAFQPASESGDEGIEELYRQTAALLNFQEIPREVFGRQLAFNLAPSLLDEDGAQDRPAADLPAEVLRVTGGGFELAIEVVHAPVFHCQAALAHVVLRGGGRREDLLAAFEAAGGVQVVGAADGATPVARAGKEGIVVAGLRPAGSPGAFWIWALSDNQLSGNALNAVRIAETLVARGLGRRDQ